MRDLSVCTDIKKPTAYYLLNKMAEKGWITQSSEQVGNRPPRNVYKITEAGEAAFHTLLHASLQEYSPVYFEDDIPLAFLDEIENHEAHQLLQKRKETLLKEIKLMQETPTHAGSIQWMLEHRLRHLNAELEWMDEILLRLSTSEEK
jgi:DNA-binding PadR family transcriptional regulator